MTTDNLAHARNRLINAGGRISQDVGLGRIVGQVLVYLYLQPAECPLEELESELGLSKASVSIAARQLETLGMVKRVWRKGDRKKYYRSADNLASALQQGILTQLQQKVRYFGEELEVTIECLNTVTEEEKADEVQFLTKRVTRAIKLQDKLSGLLGNPLLQFLSKIMK